MAEKENLKNTLLIEETEYNINAVYSDKAHQVDNKITFVPSLVTGDSEQTTIEFDGSEAKEISYVPAEGGKFTGEVLLDNKYTDLGGVKDESIINFKQIDKLVSTLKEAPICKWSTDKQQLDSIVGVNSTFLRLNTVVGTSEDFNSESFKRFMGVPDLSNAENRYYGMTLGTLDTNTCAISSYKGTHTTVYIPSRGYPTTSADGTLKLSDCRTVTTIGRGVFKGNTTIEEVIIPESVTTIESEDSRGTFQSCTKLKSIKLPSGLTKINAHTFNGCTGLTEIVIGKKVAKISKNAFNNCSSLRKVYYEGTEEDWKEFVSTSTINSSETKQIHSIGNTTLTDVYDKRGTEGYEFIFNYKYTPDIRDLPCLFICADSGVETSNKMFLKMPDSGIFLDVTQGATRLDSTLATSTNYYTYEGLAEIIARINLRLDALGVPVEYTSLLQNAPLTLDKVNELVSDIEIKADLDPDAIPTIQELDARLESIETELSITDDSLDTRLDKIESEIGINSSDYTADTRIDTIEKELWIDNSGDSMIEKLKNGSHHVWSAATAMRLAKNTQNKAPAGTANPLIQQDNIDNFVDAGGTSTPVYFKDGVPVACTSLSLNTTGNATTATTATQATKLVNKDNNGVIGDYFNVGSKTQPVYFSGGTPKQCDYSLNTNVPSDAVFTDSKVRNTPRTLGLKAYITGTTGSTEHIGPQYFDTGVYLGTNNGELVATTFKGDLDGDVKNLVSYGKDIGSGATMTSKIYFVVED